MGLTFEERQYLRRAVSEARKAALQPPPHLAQCPGCGINKDEQTAGCKVCTDRHYSRNYNRHRREVGRPRTEPEERRRKRLHALRHGICIGCGVPHDQQTVGCMPCYDRARRRRTNALYNAA